MTSGALKPDGTKQHKFMATKKVIVENQAISIKDTEVKFGLGQITKTTPPLATNIFRVVLYTVGVLNIATMTFTAIPADVADMINKWSAEVIVFAHAVTKLFGLNIEK